MVQVLRPEPMEVAASAAYETRALSTRVMAPDARWQHASVQYLGGERHHSGPLARSAFVAADRMSCETPHEVQQTIHRRQVQHVAACAGHPSRVACIREPVRSGMALRAARPRTAGQGDAVR